MNRPRNFKDIIYKIQGAKQSGDEWISPCPLPGHITPQGHLTITDAGDKALVTCQGGKHSYWDICLWLGFDSLTYLSNGDNTKNKKTAIYDYTDANGKLLYQVIRYTPKGFKQRRPNNNSGWIWDLKGVEPVLYRLPEVLRAVKEGRNIYICEGEKDCDNLTKIGLTTSTNSGGAEKWRREYAEALINASIIILPDKDTPGEKHASKIVNSLRGKARSIKVLELPDIDGYQVKDVSDWLAAGGTVEELEQMVSETPEYELKENDNSLVCMADVEPETVSWLWFPYIPKGKLTLIEGDPGIGKSWVCLAITTAISLGNGLPGNTNVEPQSVLLATAEDGLGDTIRPRLDAMGANVKNIYAIKITLDFSNGGLDRLEGYISQRYPVLVIIDPLVAYIGAGVDLHRANETRAVMARLADIAEKHGCAILAVRHLTKGGTLKPLYRGIGSIDLAAACRSVLLAGCDPNNPQLRGIVHIKSNLAPMGAAIGYEIKGEDFYWTGESDLTATRILAIADSGEVKSAKDEAADFIREELASGPVESAQVWKDAKEAGLSNITVKRAKALLGIITRRHGETGKKGGGRFTWELPESNLEAQKDLEAQEYHIQEKDTLNNSSFESRILLINHDPPNPENVLSMSVEKAVDIWHKLGSPVIHLGPGENCIDLEKLLFNSNVKPTHLEVVGEWLNKVSEGIMNHENSMSILR